MKYIVPLFSLLLFIPSFAVNFEDVLQRGLKLKQDGRDEVAIPLLQEAAKGFKDGAKEGELHAQKRIALMYYLGLGVHRSYVKAERWFKVASLRGDKESQFYLGVMYDGSLSEVSKSYEKSRIWFERAAKQDHQESQYRLGIIYYKGLGISQDHRTAAYWFKKAASTDHADSQYYLGLIYYYSIDVDEVMESKEWFKKAAGQGHKAAISALRSGW